MKKLRVFNAMLVNGFRGVLRNMGIGLISTMTIFAVMLLVGTLLLTVLNINGYVNTITNDLDKIVLYLLDGTTFNQADELMNELSARPEIDEITYISRDQAVIEAKEMFKDNKFVIEGLEKNPLPASIILKINDLEAADKLVEHLKSNKKIEEVKYFKDLINKFVRIDSVIKIGSFIAFLVIIVLSIFVISNIIKVAISSRKTEIEIMKYVGASESYIKGPFVIEGLFYSILGGIIAFFAVMFLYSKFTNTYSKTIYEYINYSIISIDKIKVDLAIILISVTIGIGSIGSLSSIRKYLKV